MPGGTALAQQAPREAILNAIEAAEGKGVTVAAVTAATGLPTDVVEMEMASLLRACNGFFGLAPSPSAQDDPSAPKELEYRAQVLDTSGVQYIYPKGLRSLLWHRSLRLRLRTWAAALGTAAFAVLRVSFGVLLLLSLAIVVVVMLVLIARTGGGGGGGDRHGRHGLEGAFRLMRPRRPVFDAGDLYWYLWWREWWLSNPFFYGWDGQERMRQEAEARRRRVLARLDEEEAGGVGLEMVEGSVTGGTRSTRRRTQSVSSSAAQRRAGTGSGSGSGSSGRYDELEEEDDDEGFDEDEEDEVEEDLTFLEAVFSLLFGDGPPGPSENERWQRIARLIHEKQGVVVAEEVVPLLTDARGAEEDPDRSMLPVLERFGGKPIRCCLDGPEPPPSEASDNAASYIWDFARMREGPPTGGATKLTNGSSGLMAVVATPTTNTSSKDDAALLAPPTPNALALVPATEKDATRLDDYDDDGAYWTAKAYLEEKRYRFSRAPLRHLQMAGALGLVNLVGAMWLLDQWRLFPPPTAQALYVTSRVLACYAWAFLLLPLLRLAVIARWNKAIKRRNALRRFLLDDLKARGADPATALNKRLEFASRYRALVMSKGGVGGAF